MALYSFKGQYPTELPNRIRLPDGSTKTDISQFSSEDISLAGFVEVPNPPIPSEGQLVSWDTNAWFLETVEQPFSSWTWADSRWVSPVPYPNDGNTYQWNEVTLSWELVS